MIGRIGAKTASQSRAGAANARARRANVATFSQMLVVPIITVALWYILSWAVFVVPAPDQTIRSLVSNLENGQYRGDLVATLVKIMVASGIAATLGIVAGTVLGLAKPLREALEPLVLITNGIPKIVVYPILLIVFGLGNVSQITMGVIFGTLPVLVNVMSALASMRPVYRKVTRMLEVGHVRALFRVYLPAIMPMLMVALQLGFSLSVLGVVYSELIASQNGLGQRIIQTYSVGSYDKMASSVLVILVIALGGAGLLHLIERFVVRHR